MLRRLGDTDFTVRLSAVLFGTGRLLFAWPLRRYVGRSGALSFLVLAGFSPALTYFTRFLRHDIYLALCNLAAIYWAFRHGDTRQPRYLYLSAASLALAFCTKEDMYLLTPLFLLCLLGALLWEVLGATDRRAALRGTWKEITGFFATAWIPLLTSGAVFAVVWLLLYTSFFTHPENWNAVERAISYWWGQHTIQRIGGPWWYYFPQLSLYEPLLAFPFFATIIVPLLRVPARDALGRWLTAVAVAAAVGFAVSLFALPAQAPRILLGAGVLAIAALATRWVPSRFDRFCILWTLGALATYAWAQEKVPWLLVPMLLPLALVAGRWFGELIDSGALRRPVPVLLVAAVGALTLGSLVAVNYLYDAPRPAEPKNNRHAEMLVYVHSTYDVIKAMRKIEDLS